ncbi:MAG: hypothetical protein QM500_21400 [Methylococcales bacterium]
MTEGTHANITGELIKRVNKLERSVSYSQGKLVRLERINNSLITALQYAQPANGNQKEFCFELKKAMAEMKLLVVGIKATQ